MPIEPREHFWNIDLIGLFYALSLVAGILFLLGVVRMVRRWRSGWRISRAAGASDRAMADVVFGAAIFRGDRPAGLTHLLVLWGFAILFLGTVLLTVDHYLVRFLTGRVWLIYSLALDLFGLAFIVSLLWLLVRRHVFKRHILFRAEPEDTSLLALLLLIAVTGFLVEGFRMATTRPAADDWSPVGAALAAVIPSGHLGTYRALWWLHAVASLALVAWIPFGKLRHLITSPLHRLRAGRIPVLRTADERAEAAVAFGAHELLALDACTRCNRCQNICPSFGVAEMLSPRAVIADLHRASRGGLTAAARLEAGPDEVPWLCTGCGACRSACPLHIDGQDLIRETRGAVVEEGTRVPEGVARALESIAKHGNPWEGKRSKRAAWAEDLELADHSRGASAPRMWVPGCTLAYDTRCQSVARATAALFRAAGFEVMIGGKLENCSGDLARRCGEDGLFEMMVEENMALFEDAGVAELVVSSPHDWHALGFEYPKLAPLLPEVKGPVPSARHVSEVLAERIEAGALTFTGGPARRVTFHDPCYLGRQHGLVEAPRRILAAIPGVTLVEMDENRERSRCCGGGGGRMWFEPEGSGKMKMSERRVRQAAATGAEVLAVACPYCLIQFEDAVKTAGLEGTLRVADVTELAAEAMNT